MDYSKLPIFAESEIVVCGGGTAGAFAAKAAADMGSKVLIVEQFGSLGGSATNGLVSPVMHTHIEQNPQCSYIANIVRDKLLELGATVGNGANFDPLILKAVLEEICVDAGVELLFHTMIADVIKEDNKVVAIVVANKDGLGIIKGKIFIDATGDGDVCVRAGAGYTKGNPETGKNQPISLRYMVANVDFEAFGAFILDLQKSTGKWSGGFYEPGNIYTDCVANDRSMFSEIFDKAIEAGDLIPEDKAYWQGFTVTGRGRCLSFNNPEFFDETDGTNPRHLTNTQVAGKKAIIRQLKFYKKYFKGFEDAYISDIASMVGIRESRNIEADYVLSATDLLSRKKFDDMFCQSNYPVDIHGKVLRCDNITSVVDDGKPWYEIPYRSLVVKGFDNLYITGRCLGAEFLAQSSLRVQQSVRASGEAAGIGAALATQRGVTPRDIDGKEVREIMVKNGADFI